MTLFNLTEAQLRERTSMKWNAYDPDVLPLWVAEMDVLPHPVVRQVVVDAIERGDTGYPSGVSYSEAYADMAEARWGWRPEPEQCTRSGDVMNAILAVLLGNTREGDHVVINPPVYPPFWQVVQGYGRRLTQVPLREDGRLDLAGLEAAFTGPDKPAAYLLCSPHNPTGTVHTAEELREVARLCDEHDVLLVVDEIHALLVDPGTEFTPILSLPEAQKAVVAFSAGKAWNLAAFKGGQLIRGRDAQAVVDRLGPLAAQSTGQFAMLAHTAALQHAQDWVDEVMIEVAQNKDLLGALLAEHLPAVIWHREPGTYLAWLDCTALGLENASAHFLEHARVALNDGTNFGPQYGQFVRLNLATSPEIITEAVRRMGASVA